MNSSSVEVYPHTWISFEEALHHLDEVGGKLFSSDLGIQSVGITRLNDGFGFRATRNTQLVLPHSSASKPPDLPWPIVYVDVADKVRPLSRPRDERDAHRPLVCGLQIQNIDFDTRIGNTGMRRMTTGSLGCFVRRDDWIGIMSNNHVLAGENRGYRGDRIVQPGAVAGNPPHIGELESWVPLKYSPATATPITGNVNWNEVDAAIAFLTSDIHGYQRYLPHHNLPSISGVANAHVHETVFKVGPTSALTRGSVVAINTQVPSTYAQGVCWFQNSIEIKGEGGRLFSAYGDSGAVVINRSGKIIGVLYSGNGTTSFACPISSVMQQLNCSLHL